MAVLALALRFVPYSDNHGHFDALWTAVMAFCGLLALAASVYLVYVLEILKLRRGQHQPRDGSSEASTRRRGVRRSIETRRRVVARPRTRITKPIIRPFGYSRSSARTAEPGVFMSPPKYVDLLLLAAALAVFWSRTAHARLRGRRRRMARPARDPDARRRAPRPSCRRQPPAGDGDRRRDDPRAGLADGHRGPARRPARRARRRPRRRAPRRSSSSPSPSPPRASPTSSEPEGQGVA